MKNRLFFLKQDGWFEAEVAGKLLRAPLEELCRWAYTMMEQHNYRNYLITENPRPPLRANFSTGGNGMMIPEGSLRSS